MINRKSFANNQNSGSQPVPPSGLVRGMDTFKLETRSIYQTDENPMAY